MTTLETALATLGIIAAGLAAAAVVILILGLIEGLFLAAAGELFARFAHDEPVDYWPADVEAHMAQAVRLANGTDAEAIARVTRACQQQITDELAARRLAALAREGEGRW